MDFELNDEQRMLGDSVTRLLGDRYPDMAARAAVQREPDGWSRTLWKELAEMGLLAAPFAEADGGLGQGLEEIMLIAEAFGRAQALEPFFPTVVLGGGVLRHGASGEQKADLIPGVIAGERLLALAHQERQARHDLADVATTARPDGAGGYLLDGEKIVVFGGDSADTLVVSARLSGERRDEAGIGLFLVDAGAEGVSRRGYRTQDGLRACDLRLAGVRVAAGAVIGGPADGFGLLSRVVDEAIAWLAAEAVGAMERLHAMTVDYMKTREQFGVPIGSFQVLQHRAVDMFTHLEQARSMACYATLMAGDPDPAERRRAVAAAKVQIGRSARFVGEQAIQLHGGIGMTMEYAAGQYYKRLTMIDLTFGDADHHLATLAASGGLLDAA